MDGIDPDLALGLAQTAKGQAKIGADLQSSISVIDAAGQLGGVESASAVRVLGEAMGSLLRVATMLEERSAAVTGATKRGAPSKAPQKVAGKKQSVTPLTAKNVGVERTPTAGLAGASAAGFTVESPPSQAGATNAKQPGPLTADEMKQLNEVLIALKAGRTHSTKLEIDDLLRTRTPAEVEAMLATAIQKLPKSEQVDVVATLIGLRIVHKKSQEPSDQLAIRLLQSDALLKVWFENATDAKLAKEENVGALMEVIAAKSSDQIAKLANPVALAGITRMVIDFKDNTITEKDLKIISTLTDAIRVTSPTEADAVVRAIGADALAMLYQQLSENLTFLNNSGVTQQSLAHLNQLLVLTTGTPKGKAEIIQLIKNIDVVNPAVFLEGIGGPSTQRSVFLSIIATRAVPDPSVSTNGVNARSRILDALWDDVQANGTASFLLLTDPDLDTLASPGERSAALLGNYPDWDGGVKGASIYAAAMKKAFQSGNAKDIDAARASFTATVHTLKGNTEKLTEFGRGAIADSFALILMDPVQGATFEKWVKAGWEGTDFPPETEMRKFFATLGTSREAVTSLALGLAGYVAVRSGGTDIHDHVSGEIVGAIYGEIAKKVKDDDKRAAEAFELFATCLAVIPVAGVAGAIATKIVAKVGSKVIADGVKGLITETAKRLTTSETRLLSRSQTKPTSARDISNMTASQRTNSLVHGFGAGLVNAASVADRKAMLENNPELAMYVFRDAAGDPILVQPVVGQAKAGGGVYSSNDVTNFGVRLVGALERVRSLSNRYDQFREGVTQTDGDPNT